MATTLNKVQTGQVIKVKGVPMFAVTHIMHCANGVVEVSGSSTVHGGVTVREKGTLSCRVVRS